MHPWFRWIVYINPARYAFNGVMASEMADLQMTCVEPQLVPYGPSYSDSRYQSCTVIGSDGTMIDGTDYLRLQYGIARSEIWRNVGIIIAFWVFFAFMTAVGFEVNLASDGGSKILYDRRAQSKELALKEDPEKFVNQHLPNQEIGTRDRSRETIFTFDNISYFVHHEGQEKQLL